MCSKEAFDCHLHWSLQLLNAEGAARRCADCRSQQDPSSRGGLYKPLPLRCFCSAEEGSCLIWRGTASKAVVG